MDIEIIRRICLARHLYELGRGSLMSANDLYLFSAVNLFQDAAEAFLLAVADFVDAPLDERTHFGRYFVLINERISPKELPFKNRLLRLNRVRIDSKHHGIQPARDECHRLSIAVREFLDEVSSSVLGVSFSTVSAIDLMRDGETKDLLLAAKAALERQEFVACAIDCRKAIHLELERSYDISDFREGAEPRGLGGLLGPYSKAPYYATNKEYVEKNVRDPTDYIVYDHSDLDQELLKYSVDNTAFWNLWRLTPEVYLTTDKEWVVKYDFDKLDEDILPGTIEYIFNTAVDLLIAIHAKKDSVRTPTYRKYSVELARAEVPVFEKADRTSKTVCNTPASMTQLDCDFHVMGLQGDGPYWHVFHLEGDSYVIGYIHNDDVKEGSG